MSKTKDPKTRIIETRQTIDFETGEVMHEDRLIQRRVSSNRFIMVYLDDMASVLGLSKGAEYKVLMWLWERAEFDTNKIVVVKAIKKEMESDLDVAYRTIVNSITSLTRKGLLLNPDRSVYYLNPKYFFKGSEMARRKQIRVLIEYNLENNQDGSDGQSDEE